MNIKNFLSTRNKSDDFNKNDFRLVALDEEQKSFVQIVFAPSPETGNPVSAVAYMMSSSDEGFKNYVRENLLSAVTDGSMAENADDALAVVKANLVTSEEYLDFMSAYVIEQMSRKED